MARVSQTRVRVEGLEGLERANKRLIEAILQSDGAKRVNRIAALASRKIIKANAPPDKGVSRAKGWTPIRESIDVRQSGMPAYVFQNRNKNPAGLWLEHGTDERVTRGGAGRGRVEATRWWSRGRNKSRATVRKTLRAGYQKLVEGIPRAGR